MDKIAKITVKKDYFNIYDTLECGQVFRFKPYNNGFLVFSLDKCAYCYEQDEKTVIECCESDKDYFCNYFDLERDYAEIVKSATQTGVEVLTKSANLGKGIRILNQDKTETLFSFIVSQNNNIPRIKGIIERLCKNLGNKKTFLDFEYYTFPSVSVLAQADVDFYKGVGLGYRAPYIKSVAERIENGFSIDKLNDLNTLALKKQLISLHGVGPKVADCVTFFGFHRGDSFPVDTWIEKVYKQDFKGKINNRDKIAEYFVDKFGTNAGYFQQYLFYYKRTLEEKE